MSATPQPDVPNDAPLPVIQTVAVIGAGQMGRGIAQVMAQHGRLNVIVQDVDAAALQQARQHIDAQLRLLQEKALLSGESPQTILQRIQFEAGLTAIQPADLVIEAIVENEAVKKELFGTVDAIAKPAAILASNTSSISITRLAAATQRPSQVIGMHFMNPVPRMRLVEVIRGAKTSRDTCQAILALSERLDKVAVISRDFPGFIANRILMPLINEAIFALYEGLGSPEDIDAVMTLGMNHPMGPLALADFIGLDTCLSIMNTLHDGFQDARFRPCPLLKQYVDAGWYGRKSGEGFFVYPPSETR